MKVVKDLNPSSDPGTFNLIVDGTTLATGGDGADTGFITVNDEQTYTIKEAGANGTSLSNYTTADLVCVSSQLPASTYFQLSDADEVTGGGAKVKIKKDGADITCTIKNTRKTGKIKFIKKNYGGSSGDTFTLAAQLGANTPVSVPVTTSTSISGGFQGSADTGQIPVGNYTVSETGFPGGTSASDWTTTISCSGNGSSGSTAKVSDDGDVTCTVTNTRTVRNGSLKIKKVISGGTGGETFTFSVKDPSNNPVTLSDDTLGQNETATATDLTPGSPYTIKESPIAGWTMTVSGSGCSKTAADTIQATITADTETFCTVTNTRQTGSIKIQKQTVGGEGAFQFTHNFATTQPMLTSPFTLDTTGKAGHTDATTMITVPTGVYTVAELVPAGWSVTQVQCSGGGGNTSTSQTSATIGLDSGEAVICTFIDFKKKDDRMDEVTQLYVHRRVDNLLTHGPDRARLLRRLEDSDQQPLGSLKDGPLKFAGNTAIGGRMGSTASNESSSGSGTYIRDGQIYHDGQSVGAADRASDYYGMNDAGSASNSSMLSQIAGQLTTIAGGMRDFKFSTSLSELRRDAQDAEQRRQQKLLADAGLGFVSEGFADRASQMRQGLDVWVEGQISKYDDGLGGYDRDGDFRVLYVGADYALAPGVLVGALVQVDDTREDVNKSDLTGKVEGTGWMVGPYVGIKLTDNLFFDARAAYGTSSNDIWLDDSAAGYRSASFDTDRWLTTATLTGNEYIGNFRFSPQLGLAYGREWYGDYYNSIGQLVEGRDISIARINATLEVGYRFDLVDGTMIEPHVSISGIANFSGDDLIVAGEIIDPNENRAKIEGGFIVQTREGYAIRAAAAYDGIGQSDFEAYSGSLWLNVPLN
ncbi:MAG: autotransporter domain-containing protein [Hyphomicrobiaceae bacterium]|nr:autotransporter domain-containing protein [Hyphomicrobiaceae bacterium]